MFSVEIVQAESTIRIAFIDNCIGESGGSLQPRPTLISIFHPKKIKGFLTLIKKSMIAEKIKSFTLNNAILRLRTLK